MKKYITIAIVIVIVLGFGFYLYKISPQQAANSNGAGTYNSAIKTDGYASITTPPAFDPNTDHYQGNAKAKNVFIEYADYECPACASYSEMLKQVPSTFPDTVFVYRYFPLVQIHPNSVEAAAAAEAAGSQGKYWEMHDLLFKNQTSWQDLGDPLTAFAQYAQQAGVSNLDQFKSDVSNKSHLDAIQKGESEALGMNLPGTPSFFVNGHLLKGGVDINGLLAQAQPYINK